ncbi:hypothetical protein PT2222_50022 [Paraburkholderia tropica]
MKTPPKKTTDDVAAEMRGLIDAKRRELGLSEESEGERQLRAIRETRQFVNRLTKGKRQ